MCASECCARVSDKQGLTRVLCNFFRVLLLFENFYALYAHNSSAPKQTIIPTPMIYTVHIAKAGACIGRLREVCVHVFLIA